MWSYSLSNHNHCQSFQFPPLYVSLHIGRWNLYSIVCRYALAHSNGESVLLWQDDKTRLMAENRWVGPSLHELASILFEEWIQSSSDWTNICGKFNTKILQTFVHLSMQSIKCVSTEVTLSRVISNSMSNFQLSTSCQPLSPLSSHQRPTLAFCPPANGWKLLEMLEHMLLPLAIPLSLHTYLQPQSAKSYACISIVNHNHIQIQCIGGK